MKNKLLMFILTLSLVMIANAQAESFKIAVLPDTQLYSQDYPEIFADQTQWVAENVESENIAFLTQLGDIVNHGDNADEWANADAAMDLLDGVLPYSVCLGNHDYYTNGDKNDGCFYYDFYFGPSRYYAYKDSWYGGSSRRGTSHYQVFEAGGRTWLHLNMEYLPDVEVLLWAQRVLDAHPDLPTIYSTHAYIKDTAYEGGYEDPNIWSGLPKDGDENTINAIADIGGHGQWTRLINNNDQIFLVLNGHSASTDGEGLLVTENLFGNKVIQVCQDYQYYDNGGNGWMRLYEFDDINNQINVKTYSPTLNGYMDDEDSEFSFSVDFAARFDSIARREEVPTVQAANIKVIQHGTGNEPEDVSVYIPAGQRTEMFGLTDPNDETVPHSNRGDYHPQIGSAYTDDMENGIFFAAIAENGRTNENYATQTVRHFHTASIGHGQEANWLAILTTGQMFGETYYTGAHEDNVNVGAAYFPFSGGWTGGYVCNLDNNGQAYVLKGSENITLGDQLISSDGSMEVGPYNYTYTDGADWQITIPGVDSRYDGVLLACGGKNEDNYAVSGAALDGSGWVISVRDNAQLSKESDPFNFVYVPFETPGIAAGVLSPKLGIYNGSVNSEGLFNFAIEHITTGTIRLTIDGQTPETGTLLISGCVSRYSTDNIVVYEPDGDGWLIYVYDLNNGGATNLQDMNDEGVQFAFIPFENPPAAPGPSRGFDTSDISAADFTVTSTGDISVNQVYGSIIAKSKRNYLSVAACDRGDFYLTRNGARLSAEEGVLLATIRQSLRKESGDSEYYHTVVSPRRDSWLAIAKTTGGEYNADFATAFFPFEAGFTSGHIGSGGNVDYSYGLSVSVTPSYAGYAGRYLFSMQNASPEDGILFAAAQCNNDRFANIAPDGGSWDIAIAESQYSAGYKANDFGYLYVPYTSREIMLGRVSGDGDVVNGNGLFTVTREDTGVYRVSLEGCSPAAGMLVLNSYGTDLFGPARVLISYEDDGDDFIVYTAEDLGSDYAPVAIDSDFVFGYVPFDKNAEFADCSTNMIDFGQFASQWLSSVDSPVFDYDNSNQIDYVDLAQFAECWLR